MKAKILLNRTDKFDNYFLCKKSLMRLDTSKVRKLEIFLQSQASCLIAALLHKASKNFEITVYVQDRGSYEFLKFLKLDQFIKVIFDKTQ